MDILLQQIINGLVLGSMYALIALGYTMVYGIIQLINFAHGEVLMIGALTSWSCIGLMQEAMPGAPGWIILLLATLIACVVAAALNFVIEKVAYKPLRSSPRLAPLITAIGMSILLQTLAMIIWKPNYKPYPTLLPTTPFQVGGAVITSTQVLILSVTVVALASLVYLVNYTKLGRAMRATAENPRVASLMGVKPDMVISATFIIGAILAAIAGIMYASNYGTAQHTMGFLPGLKAFTAAVFGGIGNLAGAVVGSSTIEIGFDAVGFADGQRCLDRFHEALSHPVDFDGERHIVRAAIGGAGGPKADVAEIDLIEAAERALHDARLRGGDRLDDLGDPRFAIDPMDLMRDLPAAIANGEIFLQYQPKLHVRRQCVASAEALVRWRHPIRGLIFPGSFIEMAERCLEIAGLTLWTLRQAVADQRALAAEGYDFPLFVNISGVLLSDEAFVAEACALVSDSGAQIGVEITETAVIRDPETAIANLKRMAKIGVRLAIDDYGAGLSSLSYLKRLPAGELKIDKSFVTELTSSNRDPLIVRSTIDLAHALDMEVTAEGVETPAVMALLSVMGCDMVQGYLISRPIELDALRRFLTDSAHIETVASSRLSFRRSEAGWIGR